MKKMQVTPKPDSNVLQEFFDAKPCLSGFVTPKTPKSVLKLVAKKKKRMKLT